MSSFVRGMQTGLYVSEPAPYPQGGTLTAVRISVQEYRPAGSTSVPVRIASGQSLPRLAIPAGSPVAVATTQFLVTTDAEVRTDVVQDLQIAGGLPISLSVGAVLWAAPQSLNKVHGTSDTDVEITTGTQDATSAISNSPAAAWSVPAVTSKSWRLPRRGRFRPTDPAYRAVRQAALGDDLVLFVRRVLPDEQGEPVQAEGGWAIITEFSAPAPADGVVDAAWVFQGVGPLEDGVGAVQPDLSGVMLDFSKAGNAINFGFA